MRSGFVQGDIFELDRWWVLGHEMTHFGGKGNAPGATARGTGELDSLCERVHRNSAEIVSKELAANCKAGLQLTHDPRYRCTIGWSFTIVKASIVSPVMVLK